MYSFFELSGTRGARIAAAAAGSLIITAVMMATATAGTITPTNPATQFTIGALA